MARILGIDYGTKKCGVSATDAMQIIVSSVGTIPTSELFLYLKNYTEGEEVEKIVFGKPTHKDGASTYLQEHIDVFVKHLSKEIPNVIIDYQDERMTSVEAKNIILLSGIKKSKRRDKTLVDKISAVLILQKYLGHI
ncbi:MAG: putative Holliday junction resolvase [Saprospiraceae bacterium]|jgi:putative Holliday junction resolvase|tara:strand:- start:248 stop:658 length:411 start_codon:yes stop_codon:yes gene_type:complete